MQAVKITHPSGGGDFEGNQTDNTLRPASDYFSFNTTKQVSLSVDYGKRGSRATAEVYIKNPAYTGEDGQTYFKGRPVFKAHCDENGRFEGKINLPTYVDKVYIYTMRMGVPQLVGANVENSAVALNATTTNSTTVDASNGGYGYDPEEAAANTVFKEPIAKSTVKEKDKDTGLEVEKTYNIWQAPTMNDTKNVYSIVNWAGQRFGRIIPTHYWDTKGNRYDIEDKTPTYNNQGLIEDLTENDGQTDDPDILNGYDIDVIQHFLWDGNKTKPSGLNNTKYQPENTRDINTVIPTFYLKNGKQEPIKHAQVWLRFLGEGAWFCDGIGYYYYKTNDPPREAKKDQVKTYYIAIPNTSSTAPFIPGSEMLGRTVPFLTWTQTWENVQVPGSESETKTETRSTDEFELGGYFNIDNKDYNYTFNPKYVPFDTNQRIQLLFHDPVTNEVSKYFPAGYTIGFFVVYSPNNKGGDFINPDNKTMRINTSDLLHSDKILNGGKKRYIALNYKNFAIYGVEDGADNSYEDILFAIETDPVGLVVNRNRTTIEDENHEAVDEYKTYAYEDIWPDGGDYDINDVVIEHYHKMTYTRNGGIVTKIEDEFIAVQPSNAATYRDAFAIQIPKNHEGEMKLYKEDESGRTELNINDYLEEDENGRKSVIIFNNIMQEQYDKRILVRDLRNSSELKYDNTKLEEEIDKNSNELRNVLNPFIISQYDDNQRGQKGRTEIHLPKHSPTSFANSADIGKGDDAYYTDKNGKYPFAISLPVPVVSGDESEDRFIVIEENEGKRISEVYPDFTKWVKAAKIEDKTEREAQLQRYGDWYLRYGKSIDPTP